MKLYMVPGSPYARLARVLIAEKNLQDRVQIVQAEQLRAPDSPYYAINPSGRVPYLALDDGTGVEGSSTICAYLDQVDQAPLFHTANADLRWQVEFFDAKAMSMLDGLAVWARELRRVPEQRSPAILQHETARFGRMADEFEAQVDHPVLSGEYNRAQLTLACTLGFALACDEGCTLDIPEFDWRSSRPKLSQWYRDRSSRPAFAEHPAVPMVIK